MLKLLFILGVLLSTVEEVKSRHYHIKSHEADPRMYNPAVLLRQQPDVTHTDKASETMWADFMDYGDKNDEFLIEDNEDESEQLEKFYEIYDDNESDDSLLSDFENIWIEDTVRDENFKRGEISQTVRSGNYGQTGKNKTGASDTYSTPERVECEGGYGDKQDKKGEKESDQNKFDPRYSFGMLPKRSNNVQEKRAIFDYQFLSNPKEMPMGYETGHMDSWDNMYQPTFDYYSGGSVMHMENDPGALYGGFDYSPWY